MNIKANAGRQDKVDTDFLEELGEKGLRERLVYLVSKDYDYGQVLAQQIEHFGYRVHMVEDFQKLEKAIAKHQSAAILIDIQLEESASFTPQFREELQRWRETTIPIMFVSNRDNQPIRLEAVRANGNAFFVKPVDVVSLIDKLDELNPDIEATPSRVMVVEDQSTIGNYYQMVLNRAGMISDVVNDPACVLQKIDEFNPDLILLDLYMPGISGVELTKMIRQIDNYVSIPIVFIGKENNFDKQMEVLSLGGDDFLTKPINGNHLVSVVKNRLERLRSLRSFMIRDSLTGLLNHTSLRESLKQEINRCRRHNSMLALAMIDLDFFKSVNDTYGHSVGDSVLKSISRLLRQRLRKSDIIGRYGGEEFVVILPETDIQGAVTAMESLLGHFSQIRHHAPTVGEFSVTFSCGIAGYPQYKNEASLSDAADRALYLAKAAGRNRVMVAQD